MPYRIGTIFALTALAFVFQAIRIGGYGYLLLWPASAFAILGIAYLFTGPSIFGKRLDGRIRPLHQIVTVPAAMFMRIAWLIENVIGRRDAYNEIAPGLFIGRRPTRLPPGIQVVIDLAGEMPAHRCSRAIVGYRSVPVLDRWVTDDKSFVELVLSIARSMQCTFVHCAQGHGRSAEVVAGVLIARGVAKTADEAIELLKSVRPGVGLAPMQRMQLERCASLLII